MLATAETHRRTLHAHTDRAHKAAMGQFMTPAATARFMASLFPEATGPRRLLDAGAGLGALTCAVLDGWTSHEQVEVEAYEVDGLLLPHLIETLRGYGIATRVHDGNFLDDAARRIWRGERPFTHAILNPPYKKIAVHSPARHVASRVGLETVNLYSAFVGLSLALLADGGQLVAIIPRSFCNGPYYRPFREWMLQLGAIRHLHLFGSRDSTFRDDGVLQESLILRIERGGTPGPVVVTHSTDDGFSDLTEREVAFERIVHPDDAERFIRIPTGDADPLDHPRASATLDDLGLGVSTGPVVDFRLKDWWRASPGKHDVPLIYAHHLQGAKLAWPAAGSKKPNAIAVNDETRRWLVPRGTYVLTRRFSAKEEKRRVVAYLLREDDLRASEIGLENHLNFFHRDKRGLEANLAWGLYCWLNSTAVDEHLRRFSGHTQVNATDLRNMRYPSRADLADLGRRARELELDQATTDRLVAELLA